MSSNEFSQNEKAIDYQMENLGIPRRNDLNGNSDVVFVHSYTREDGTKVKAHYRSKNGGIMTGAAANLNPQNQRSTIDDYSSVVDDAFMGLNLKNQLSTYNHRANSNYPDARDMMDIAIYGPENMPDTNNYKIVGPSFNEQLNKNYNISIPKNLSGVIYDVNSNLSKSIANSSDFLDAVAEQKRSNFSNGAFLISLNNDQNLFRSIHNATVLNPHIDKDGYFTCLIFDLYDFEKIQDKPVYDENHLLTIESKNNIAYELQKMRILKNYYVLIPIRTKLPF